MKKIFKSALKPKIMKMFRHIEKTGEGIIITDHGKPVLKIIPYDEKSEDRLDELKGTVIKYDYPFEPVGIDYWEA